MGERSWASSTSTWAYSSGPPIRPCSSRSRASWGVLACTTGRRGRARPGGWPHLGDAVAGEVVELLDLVEAALLAGRVLHRAEPRGEVVDERDVGDRPRRRSRGRGPHEAASSSASPRRRGRPGRSGAARSGSASQSSTSRGSTCGHHSRRKASTSRWSSNRSRNSSRSPSRCAGPGGLGQGLGDRRGGLVALVLAQHLRADPVEDAASRAGRRGRRRRRGTASGASGTASRAARASTRRIRRRALDRRHGRRVEALGRDAVDDVAERAQVTVSSPSEGSTRSMYAV